MRCIPSNTVYYTRNREYGSRDRPRWPLDTLLSQKLALSSATSGGRWVCGGQDRRPLTFQHDEHHGSGPRVRGSARVVASVARPHAGHRQLTRRLQIRLFRVDADSTSFGLQGEQRSGLNFFFVETPFCLRALYVWYIQQIGVRIGCYGLGRGTQ
jgi:hypothetical protein